MPRKPKLPWLDYAGQTTAEILACRNTHAAPSLLCALEQAIQLRQSRMPEIPTTPEERTLLAVLALEREVNNGGYSQFFLNSSRQYAPTIVSALEAIGCDATAALTRQAIDAASDPDALDALDQQFYAIYEIQPKLFAFVEAHEQAIAVPKMEVAPPPAKRGNLNLIKLGTGLDFAPQPELTFDAVRKLAAEVAVSNEIQPTGAELDGAAYKFLFGCFLKAGDLERCEQFAAPAFELAREDTSHCVMQRDWVEKLIAASNCARADEVTLQYLDYLSRDDTSHPFIRNRIKFWADPLRKHGDQLPRSLEFFRTRFPDISLAESQGPVIFRSKPKD